MKNFRILILVILLSTSCSENNNENNNEDSSNNEISIETVVVEGGSFTMGCQGNLPGESCFLGETPYHLVTVGSFKIGKYEITNAQYCIFLNANSTQNINAWINLYGEFCGIQIINGVIQVKSGMNNYPVNYITWEGAKAFAEWVGGRLPTEAEWEYAARGGNQSLGYIYSGSNNPIEVGWQGDPSNAYPNPIGSLCQEVGRLNPNELGIYDMTGNVSEFCSDWYDVNYFNISPSNNPTGPTVGNYHVVKGGSVNSYTRSCRVYARESFYYLSSSGFRVVFNN